VRPDDSVDRAGRVTHVDRGTPDARIEPRQAARERVAWLLAGPRTTLFFLRRDLSDGNMFRSSLLLDLGFGLLNMVSFLFISRALQHPGGSVPGGAATYFDYVAVGLAYMLVVQATCSQLLSRVLEHQRSGTLEALVASPLSPRLMAVGLGAYPTLLGLLRSIVYLAVAGTALGMNVSGADWFGTGVVLILGAGAALSIGIALAAFAVAFRPGAAAGKTVIVGLGFLSGAYFPVSALPDPLPWVCAVLPTRMAIDGLRVALTGGAWIPDALLLAGTTAVGLPLAAWGFTRALGHARRTGTLVRG
jgi:ABC-2 type transport system permease protein